MRKKRVLLTGISGFIGHHVFEHFQKNTDWEIVGFYTFRHKGDPLRFEAIWPERTKVFKVDLSVPVSQRVIDLVGNVDYIVNMASESHVDRSISSPVPFVENNVGIGLSMLEYARVVKPKVFVQVSTDEVYGPMIGFKRHEEWDRLIPSNPYSASKAAQEMLAISYWRTYKLPVVITNTVNNFGERQDVEKFIPTVIKHILEGLPVPIHGKRGNIGSRFWLHARNHADAIMFILKNLVPTLYSGDEKSLVPDRYNITSDDELNNLDLAKMIAAHLKKKLKYRLIDFHTSRPGHDMKYGISGNLLRKRGWKQPVTFEASLFKTIDWTIEHPEWLK